MLFREQRELLEDSMKTVFSADSKESIIAYCKSICIREGLNIDNVTVKLYQDFPDERIGWDQTYIVTSSEGVLGFTDSWEDYDSGKDFEKQIRKLKEEVLFDNFMVDADFLEELRAADGTVEELK